MNDERIKKLLENRKGTLDETLGIEFIEITNEKVVGFMPVSKKVHQPFGILHGGASVVLAESLASIGAWYNLKDETKKAVGVEINANHLKSVKDGKITGTATPVRIGGKLHVWNIEMRNDQGELTCVSRCTLAIV